MKKMTVNWENVLKAVESPRPSMYGGDIWQLYGICLDLKDTVRVLEDRVRACEKKSKKARA